MALELAHDDGSFEAFEARNPYEADVVEFALPTAAPYRLIARGVRFRGAYCLSLESPGGVQGTLAPHAWVE